MLGSGYTLLLIGALLSCVYGQCSNSNTPAGCSYDCQSGQLVCHYSTWPPRSVVLSIEQCSDPLDLELKVFRNDTQTLSTQNYQVGGPVEVSPCRNDGHVKIVTTYSRNASHLNFRALGIVSGDIAIDLVPQVSLALNPHSCMCQSLDTVAENFHLSAPGFPLPLNYSCARDQACSHVQCTITDSVGAVDLFIIIDPCEEALILVPGNMSVPVQRSQLVFNRTEVREFNQEGSDFSVTVYMTLTNHNYSMEFSTQISVPQVPLGSITVFDPTNIVLDRSLCSGEINYYEGEAIPFSVCTSDSGGSSPPPFVTPPPPVTTHDSTTAKPATTSGGSTPGPTLPSSCPGLIVPAECQPLANCSGITCSSHFTRSVLVVDKCSDPVFVELTVFSAQSSVVLFKSQNFVGGPPMSYSENAYHVQYNRNTTHLMFSVTGFFEGDIADVIVHIENFPLDPHSCMCKSLDQIASSSVSFIPLTCLKDERCTSVECSVTADTEHEVVLSLQVLPCFEAIVFSQQGQLEQQTFNRTEDRPITVADDSSLTFSVFLNNHNYSMDLQADVTTVLNQQSVPVFTLPRTRVFLDRSSCSDQQLQFYTGSAPEPVILIGGSEPTPPSVSITAIAVSVPLVIILSLALIVSVTVCVVVGLRAKKKRVRAYAFSELKEDDDNEI